MGLHGKRKIFYRHNSINNMIDSDSIASIMRSDSSPIAEKSSYPASNEAALLSVDILGTPVNITRKQATYPKAYCPYGYAKGKPSERTSTGFAGETLLIAEKYLIGSFRLFDPVIMRFHSPDSLSPFARGGINTYSYCENDPINHADPSGHFRIRSFLGHTFRPKLPKYLSQQNTASVQNTPPVHYSAPPPTYQQINAPRDDGSPPSYSYTLKHFPEERGKAKYFKNKGKGLNSLDKQYDSYIAQQEHKRHSALEQVNQYNHTRSQYLTDDGWTRRHNEIDKARRLAQHYQRKIENITSEHKKLKEFISTLRSTTQ